MTKSRLTLEALAVRLTTARTYLAALVADVKEQTEVCDTIERALFDALEDQGLRSIKVDGVGAFSLNDLAWARIEDRPAALAWAEANMPEILTLNHSQLSKLVRDALKGEGEMPAGVGFTASRKINWRKT